MILPRLQICRNADDRDANAFSSFDNPKSIKAHIDWGLTEHQRFISSSLSNCHRVNDDNNKEHTDNNNNNNEKADSIEIASSMKCTVRLYYTFAVHLSIRYSQCRHSTSSFFPHFFCCWKEIFFLLNPFTLCSSSEFTSHLNWNLWKRSKDNLLFLPIPSLR